MGEIQLGAIWAQGDDRAIGANGTIPWSLPEDLEHFASITAGAPVIMGRRTWESLPESVRPLPGRVNIVVTSRVDYEANGAVLARDYEDACTKASRVAQCRAERTWPNAWIIGGASLYERALEDRRTTLALVTEVRATTPHADTFAPDIRHRFEWRATFETPILESVSGLRYSFVRFERTFETKSPTTMPTNEGTSHPSPDS